MPEFNWPNCLHAQHAVDQLATLLATARQQYHGATQLREWTAHTNLQRNYYLEMAERLLHSLGPISFPDDPRLKHAADRLAQKLDLVK
jgi:hypothetical protein